MSSRDLLRLAWQAVWFHRQRSGLTMLGILVGIASAAIVGKMTGWSTRTSPEAILVAVLFSAAVGIFFGFYPARKAASLHPIQALRYE